jgi:hypothetical protein
MSKSMIEPLPAVGVGALQEAFAGRELFDGKTWQLSPSAFPLTPAEMNELQQIGQASLDFHRALENLYVRSSTGRNILRNRRLETPWVADYFNRGKPDALRAFNLEERRRGSLPPVFRPDLLVTEEGFALTEFDSVPGGIGLTAFLNRLYGEADAGVVGSEGDAMIQGFYQAVRAAAPDVNHPAVAIVVSEEASVYRPEMEWLAEQLRERGKRVFCMAPGDLIPLGRELFFDLEGNPEKIDIIYRFFELYDLRNLPGADHLLEVWENDEVAITPPLRTLFEEKLSMALFHHHLLQDYWQEALPKKSRQVLRRIIPQSWIIDPQPLPPGAVYVGPKVGGRAMSDWRELSHASQKERDLIVKISGFHESAEGARSVIYGRDSSREEWQEGVEAAVAMSPTHLHIVQEYRKPVRRRHSVYDEQGQAREAEGRVRLCPYYFRDKDEVTLSGILATFCPADKKIIHGMKDAAMIPCRTG